MVVRRKRHLGSATGVSSDGYVRPALVRLDEQIRHYALVDNDDGTDRERRLEVLNAPVPGADTAADRQRLEILEAILAALERHHEVSDVVASSETASEARARLRELLGISQVAATEILNMQWRRLARAERQEMQARINELQGRA